jgi:hypothetical protein
VSADPVPPSASAAAKPTSYVARRAVFPEDGERVVSLWRGNLGDPVRMERKFDWFYSQSPTGEPLTLLLMFSDPAAPSAPEPVGVATAGRRPFRCGDDALEAGVLVDLTVSPRHRTLFPALLLQKNLRKEALEQLAFLYGFPNPKAAPVFKHAGYRELGTMTRYVRVLRSAQYLRARMPGWAAALAGSLWDRIAQLRFRSTGDDRAACELDWRGVDDASVGPDVATVGGQPLVRGARTPQILSWRFAARDGRSFECVAARVNGEQRGCWIVQKMDDVLHVADCAPALLAGAGTVSAWNALFAAARRRGFRSVSFECLAPPELIAALARVGFVPRTQRPAFGVLGARSRAAETGAWYLTGADEDE